MKKLFAQGGKGSTGIGTNKQAIARHFGVKQSEVVYFSVGEPISGFKVIYDKTTQRAYSLPTDLPAGTTAISLSSSAVLVHSNGSSDLGSIGVSREEFINTSGDFSVGATLHTKNELISYNGIRYRWEGPLPKVVEPGSTPQSSTSLDSGKWVSIGDSALRTSLENEDGATVSGYRNPQSGVIENVNVALDKINVRLVYATDFGVKTDGSDNAQALWDLGQFISKATEPLYVVFPRGTSLVGSQYLAEATGQGFSYRPGYWKFPWEDASDRGWFSIHRTTNDITLDMTGWTLKINDGMRQGSFDPVTGSVYNPPALPFYDYNYQAGHGFIFKIYKAPNVKIIKGTVDGNVSKAVWGGLFGDAGRQVPSYNTWFNESQGVSVKGHTSINSPVDAWYVNESIVTDPITADTQDRHSVFEDCVLSDCGRNILSYTAGRGARFNRCEFWRAGNQAKGIDGHGSGPESCVDIESESGTISDLRFYQCKLMYGGDNALQIFDAPNDIREVYFDECTLHCEETNAYFGTAKNVYFDKCIVYGGMSLSTLAKQNPPVITNTKFYNRINNRYIRKFGLTGKVLKFDNNEIYYEIEPGIAKSNVWLNLNGADDAGGGYGNRSTLKDLVIYLSGNASDIVIPQIGGVGNFRAISVHVNASLTGSKSLTLYADTSTSDFKGLSTNSSLFNFGAADSMQKVPGVGLYYDAKNNTAIAGTLTPTVDAVQGIGKRGAGFKEAWIKDAIYMYNANGQLCKVSVVGTTVTATPI